MKTSLEDKIRTHRETFDDQLPPEGHLERFVEKLYDSEQKNWQRRTFRAMMVAMAAVIAIALVFHFTLPTSTQQESLNEVEQITHYCDIRLQKQANQIEGQLMKLDPQSREAIIKEIRSIVASAQITDPEYALMTQQEQISYTVRRYNAYHQSLQTIEKMLNTLLNHTSIDSPEQKPDA